MANPNNTNNATSTRKFYYPIHPADCKDPYKKVLAPIDERSYREIMPSIWKELKRKQRRGECTCPQKKICYCDADCCLCYYKSAGNTISMSALLAAENNDVTFEQTIALTEDSPEDIVTKDFMRYALADEIKNLTDPVEKQIAVLILDKKMSEREAAKEMGIPRSTLNYRWNKIVKTLFAKFNK